MFDKINGFFQFLEGQIGLGPATVAAVALAFVVVLAIVLLILLAKLRGTKKVISELGERMGYEPPYGNGEDMLHEEYRKEILLRGKEVKITQLDQRVADLEAEAERKNADLNTLQQHSQRLENELEQASLQIDKAVAQAGEKAEKYRATAEELEQRVRQMESEGAISLKGAVGEQYVV